MSSQNQAKSNNHWSKSSDGLTKQFRFICVLPPSLNEAAQRRANEMSLSFNEYINTLISNSDWRIIDNDSVFVHIRNEERRVIKKQLLLSVFSKIRLDAFALESPISRNEIICRLIDKDSRLTK